MARRCVLYVSQQDLAQVTALEFKQLLAGGQGAGVAVGAEAEDTWEQMVSAATVLPQQEGEAWP